VPELPPMSLRVALVGIGLVTWFVTQNLIKHRPTGVGTIGDGLHTLTAPLFRFFSERPRWADSLLVFSSFFIDCLGLFVLGWSIFGPSVGPFLGMAICFGLRQICQAMCALPPPQGMIWRSPRVPTLLVTYGVANDLFFSGHTAMAVYGAIELVRWGGPAWIAVGVALALFEMATVIVLRAHYTMDVYAGAVTAIVAVYAVDAIAPTCDTWLIQLGRLLFGG
jgi:hypothetical protein